MKKQNKLRLNPEDLCQQTYLQSFLKNYAQMHQGQKLL